MADVLIVESKVIWNGIVDKVFLESNNVFPRDNLKRRPQPFGLCRRCSKAQHSNSIEIEGLDTGADVTIILPKFRHSDWPLQEVNIQLLGIGTSSEVKPSTRWVECTGPGGQIGKLKPHVANTAMNLWGRDLLQQWKTQINILPASETSHKVKNASEKDIKVLFIKNSHRLSRLSVSRTQELRRDIDSGKKLS